MDWRVEHLFQEALKRSANERARYLTEMCGGDEALRQEVESLLCHDQQADSGFLQSPPMELVEGAIRAEASQTGGSALASGLPPTEPRWIGPYRLIEKLGQGGMGQVWLAEQTTPLRRTVALKLIRAGMYDASMLQRFQAERQSLAIMDHPSIAKVFDAGLTPDGQPYFAMEYVPGVPITTYCDERRLKIRARLDLLIKVCDGVQHAHQKAIMHRDLKPANILVIEVDGKPTPRIIDFGLAKAAARQPGDDLGVTRAGGFVGTPGYVSPEQADPGTKDIDTRTDIYSLGVVLYALLTGSTPFDPQQWQNRPLDEILRHLREDEPPRPSAKVGADREALTAAAEMRQTEPRQLVSQLRGDLDSITMKTLEKDRDRRYATPTGLAADIGRYLRHEPVIAAPPSAIYQARKYVRRHRLGVAIAAGLAILLGAFSLIQAAQLRRTQRERDRANRITDFMTNMFKVSDPSEARGNTITAREILDKAAKDIDTGLSKDPELHAQMMDAMGTVYDNLGLWPQSESLLKRTVDIRRRVLGSGNPATLSSMGGLGWVLQEEGRYPEAEKMERQALDAQRRSLGPEAAATLVSTINLGAIVQREGRFADAERLEREALDGLRRVAGPEAPETLRSMSILAETLVQEGRYGEAEKLHRRTLAIRTRVLGPEDRLTLMTRSNLAYSLAKLGQRGEAQEFLRQTLDIQRRVMGVEHPDTVLSMDRLALILSGSGDLRGAEKLQRELVDVNRRIYGPEHPNTLAATLSLAGTLHDEQHLSEAEGLQRQTVAIERRVLGREHPETLRSENNLAVTLLDEHHATEAEQLDRETLEIRRRVFGPEHPFTLSSMLNLANALAVEGHFGEAERLARQARDAQRRVLGPDDPDTATSTYNLGSIIAMSGHRGDEALALLKEAVDHGLPGTADDIERDSDLRHSLGAPRFQALIVYARDAYVRQRAVAAQKLK